MEYADVTIQREEETKAKSIPRASTLNLIPAPGMTSATVYTISNPLRTTGTMEATIKNFAHAATKVHVSRIFGDLLAMSSGTTQRETSTARRGFIDVIVSI
jgi:hypothetical protein